jgi:hypothetical protein
MKKTVYIGIDDTDVLGGPGTGSVARELGAYLKTLGKGDAKAVIRHQLLVDPRIPYTSHNSSKCVLFDTDNMPQELIMPCVTYLEEHFQNGSDPGLCIVTKEQISGELLSYGQSARSSYILKKTAIDLAKASGISLLELGGTGDGIIGALAAVTLTVGGIDGRYVQLRGIKEIRGLITVAQVKEKTDTVGVIDEQGNALPDNETIDSLDWLRPSMVQGQPILRVRLANNTAGSRIWEPVEQKHRQHADTGRG